MMSCPSCHERGAGHRPWPNDGLSVDLRIDAVLLNETLFDIGVWLFQEALTHRVRVLFRPEAGRVSFIFKRARDAEAFRSQIGDRGATLYPHRH